MGTAKKEKSRRSREGKPTEGVHVKGTNFYRDEKRVKQMKVFKDGKPQRNKDGKIVQAAVFQSRDVPTAVIEPNRRWFQNSRVISQQSLDAFRNAMAEQKNDPYSVLLKRNKLPMGLLQGGSETNGIKKHQAKITLESTPFSSVFGDKATRKRVKLSATSIEDLANDVETDMSTYQDRVAQAKLLSGAGDGNAEDDDAPVENTPFSAAKAEPVFAKGQSKRIWNELYRTIDSSDVLLHLLDARDPLGTRCRSVEEYLRKEAPHKHLVFVLNKCDLVPSSVAARWVKILQKEVPCCAFKANVTNPFGKGSLIALLRQFSSLHKDRKQISVGVIGFPNIGKSSLINTLRGKKTCVTAPIPGSTLVWQYVTLMKRIFLIDSPGIVPPDQNASAEDILLRGSVRTEKVYHPAQYIAAVMKRVKLHHMERTYGFKGWTDANSFLEMLARKMGRLLKQGEPDIDGVARIVINDFLRGRIPWFTPPPELEAKEEKELAAQMAPKRKRGEGEEDVAQSADISNAGKPNDAEDDSFEGFGSESEPDAISSEDEADSTEAPVAAAVDESEDIISLGGSSDEEDEDEDGDERSGSTHTDPVPVSISRPTKRRRGR